jgi:hypothetical protein
VLPNRASPIVACYLVHRFPCSKFCLTAESARRWGSRPATLDHRTDHSFTMRDFRCHCIRAVQWITRRKCGFARLQSQWIEPAIRSRYGFCHSEEGVGRPPRCHRSPTIPENLEQTRYPSLGADSKVAMLPEKCLEIIRSADHAADKIRFGHQPRDRKWSRRGGAATASCPRGRGREQGILRPCIVGLLVKYERPPCG